MQIRNSFQRWQAQLISILIATNYKLEVSPNFGYFTTISLIKEIHFSAKTRNQLKEFEKIIQGAQRFLS